MNEKIGIIVPVYKTEKYVAECIESILAQTYTNFRLVLVDDGSPDGAGDICDEYAKKDPRITVIHQENSGVTRARAAGVEAADDCEWITFVDSDDTITTDSLKIISDKIDHDCDIILVHSSDMIDLGTEKISTSIYCSNLISGTNISFGVCGKFFNKKLFDNFIFDIPRNIVVSEDLIMNIRLAFNSKKEYVKFLFKDLYNYRIYQGSTYHSHKKTPENEQAIHEEKIRSIPTYLQRNYLEATIQTRLIDAQKLWGYKYFVKDMKKTKFYIELCSDIKKCNYKLSAIDSILFHYTSPIIRFFAINIKKVQNTLATYLHH